jgi:hypothetical protein
MVFSRARRPAFTITTNGETGILQIVQEILLVAAYQAIPGELSFAKTSSAFSFNNLGKPDIIC